MRWSRRILALSTAAIGTLLIVAPAAPAATFKPDSFADRVDATPGDGVCRAANGRCTLRAAVMEANHPATPGPHVIRLRAGTYELRRPTGVGDSFGDLEVTQPLRVVGRGPGRTLIRQTVADRIFDAFVPAAPLTLIDLALTGGRSTRGGAVYSLAPLRLDRVRASGNRVEPFSTSTGGGAIAAFGSFEMTRSRIVRNRVISSSPGVGPTGGGLEVRAPGVGQEFSISASTISNNVSRHVPPATDSTAGGLLTQGPGVIDRTTIAGNESLRGGGLFHSGMSTLLLRRSTLSANSAGNFGGGLNAFGPVTIVNSTLSGNQAGMTGSAILQSASSTSLLHVTVARGSTGLVGGAAVSAPPAGTISYRASIIAGAGIGCGGGGTLTSNGYNVSSGATCGLVGVGDKPGVNPRLAPLAANGGPTRSHALKKPSPARNAVGAGCPPPGTDQRGARRPAGPRCDAGSYEG